MYKTFFGLRENPFNVNPDPRYLYLTPRTREAMDELTYGIQNRKGFILLTGEVGTGKTTLINYLLNWLRNRKTPTAFIFNSHLSANHMFDFILTDFGIPVDFRFNGNMLMRLNTWLIERFRAGETPVLIVDEAQGLPFELLEEIRLLLNLETASEKLLQIVLAGQPELEDKLRRPEMRQLQQRITLRCNTAPLTVEETHGYITERLRIAGAAGNPIFTAEAMDAVHYYSQGIPRVINLLCEHALINSYVEHFRLVPGRMVEEAAREFFLDEVRPLGVRRNSGDVVNNNLAVMHSIIANGLARPLATAETAVQDVFKGRPTAESTTLVAREEPVVTARESKVAIDQEYELITGSKGNLGASESVELLIPAAAGPGLELKESALRLESMACNSSAAHRAPEKRHNPVTIFATASLPFTDSKAQGESIALKSSAILPEANHIRTLESVNHLPLKSPTPSIRSLLRFWKSQSLRWASDRFRSTTASPQRSHTPLTGTRTVKPSNLVAHGLLKRWIFEFKRDWNVMINAMALPEMTRSFLLWLRQPIHSNVWRQAKAAQLDANPELNQSKI
ncbi:MAG: hypothetical protein NVS9B13_03130 [Candidatus Acidiferrum sp.]